jgi:hypothetical protein
MLEVPDSWDSIFPMRAVIVRLSFDFPGSDRFATKIVGWKLIPVEETDNEMPLRMLTKAISPGPISLTAQWKRYLMYFLPALHGKEFKTGPAAASKPSWSWQSDSAQ